MIGNILFSQGENPSEATMYLYLYFINIQNFYSKFFLQRSTYESTKILAILTYRTST